MNKEKVETLKKEVMEAIKAFQDEHGRVSLYDIEEIENIISEGVKKTIDLEIDIELRGNANGTDFWLQAEYYSTKLRKSIIFYYDWASTFDSVEQLADRIVDTEKEILDFEDSVSIATK